MTVNTDERAAMIDLRVELGRRLRVCPGCDGSGRLISSGRPCPLCRTARAALEVSEAMLVPSRGSAERLPQ